MWEIASVRCYCCANTPRVFSRKLIFVLGCSLGKKSHLVQCSGRRTCMRHFAWVETLALVIAREWEREQVQALVA